MKTLFLPLAVLVVFLSAAAAWAQEEELLNESVQAVEKQSLEPGGESAVINGLEDVFGVEKATIDSLTKRGLGLGDAAAVLAMAEKMPGSIIDANVEDIMTMRQGEPGKADRDWGTVATMLGLPPGPVASRIQEVGKASMDIAKGVRESPVRKTCGTYCLPPWEY